MNDLISIVVPVRNRAAKVRRAVKSIQNQTYRQWEALVVDDGSTDETWDELQRLASEDPRVTPLRHETSRGAQAARNTGIRSARGGWIAFLDSDDEWFQDSLRLRLDVARNDGVQVVHSAALVRRPDGTEEMFPVPVMKGSVYQAVLRDPGPMFPALLTAKATLERIGYLDESIVAYQEWDTAIRLARYYEFGYVPEPTFIYDCSDDDTMSKGAVTSLEGFRQVMNKHRTQILLRAGLSAIATDYVRLARMAREAGEPNLAATYDRLAGACGLPSRVTNKARRVLGLRARNA